MDELTTTAREMESLVSVITPTFPGREQELLRCMQRVLDLDWPRVQHVVLSDRTDQAGDLAARWVHEWMERHHQFMAAADQGNGPYATFGDGWIRDLTFVQINETWRNPVTEKSIGAVPWQVGTLLGLGEFFAFCGDDDELLPHHVRRGVDAMRAAEAHWSVSQIEFRAHGEFHAIIGAPTHIANGSPRFALGGLDATGIMCHRDALQVVSWTANGENAADFRLVRDWVQAGLRGVFIEDVTGIHNDGWLIGKTGRPDRPQ